MTEGAWSWSAPVELREEHPVEGAAHDVSAQPEPTDKDLGTTFRPSCQRLASRHTNWSSERRYSFLPDNTGPAQQG